MVWLGDAADTEEDERGEPVRGGVSTGENCVTNGTRNWEKPLVEEPWTGEPKLVGRLVGGLVAWLVAWLGEHAEYK